MEKVWVFLNYFISVENILEDDPKTNRYLVHGQESRSKTPE